MVFGGEEAVQRMPKLEFMLRADPSLQDREGRSFLPLPLPPPHPPSLPPPITRIVKSLGFYWTLKIH